MIQIVVNVNTAENDNKLSNQTKSKKVEFINIKGNKHKEDLRNTDLEDINIIEKTSMWRT